MRSPLSAHGRTPCATWRHRWCDTRHEEFRAWRDPPGHADERDRCRDVPRRASCVGPAGCSHARTRRTERRGAPDSPVWSASIARARPSSPRSIGTPTGVEILFATASGSKGWTEKHSGGWRGSLPHRRGQEAHGRRHEHEAQGRSRHRRVIPLQGEERDPAPHCRSLVPGTPAELRTPP